MPTEILAKVSVNQVKVTNATDFFPGNEEVFMSPVTSDSPENKTFSEATPSGSFQMLITNTGAFGFFVNGEEYYVSFTKVPKAAEPPTQESKT